MSSQVGDVPPFEQLMTIERVDRGGWAVLVVRGSVDIATEQRLLAAAREPLVRGRRLVLDLEGVDFMSSSGAAQLVRLADESRVAGTSLRIAAGCNRRVSHPLTALGLDRALDVFGSVEQALGP